MNNIIYFDGPHGAGKTTLIQKLKESDPAKVILAQKLPITKIEDPLKRSILRLARHLLHLESNKQLAKENKDKIILVDRSGLDVYTYPKAFLNLKWISKEEYLKHIELNNILLKDHFPLKNLVIVNPKLNELLKNIEKRWENKKKWREENLEYLKETNKAYSEIAKQHPCLILDSNNLEINLKILQTWIDENIITKNNKTLTQIIK